MVPLRDSGVTTNRAANHRLPPLERCTFGKPQATSQRGQHIRLNSHPERSFIHVNSPAMKVKGGTYRLRRRLVRIKRSAERKSFPIRPRKTRRTKLLSSDSAHMEAVPVAPPQATFLGHPVGLFVLFFTEMWERFSYYGMRAAQALHGQLPLCRVRQIVQGSEGHSVGDPNAVIGWNFIRHLLGSNSDATAGSDASLIYGWYIGLVYLTPLLGGFLADRYWGHENGSSSAAR